jgi:elongation of very long chain fatty acids protein 6
MGSFISLNGGESNRIVLDTSNSIRGAPMVQLFQVYKQLEPFYFDFEKNYDVLPVLDGMARNNYKIPIATVAVYLALCYFGRIYMKEKMPQELRGALAAWNLILAIFSTYGVVRTVPHFLYKLSIMTFEESVCDRADTYYGGGACGLAVQLFILSKLPELFDTVFIVLRKKPLIFLHWYHHVTVLLYCWNSYVTESGAGIWFVAMNYTVHAVMYTYYFLAAIRAKPKWFRSIYVTILQIVQMVIGCAIVASSIYYHVHGGLKYAPGACNNNLSTLVAGGLIYASYLYLFLEYAVKRFLFGMSPTRPPCVAVTDIGTSSKKEE